MADERGTRLNEGLDKWLQVTDTDKLETWDGTDKMAAIKESLGINDNVAISDIVDDLNSTDVDKPLSANQGKVLQDSKEDADNTILKEGDVENTLTSTSTTEPLSANQGKQLNDDKASLSDLGGAAFEDYEVGTYTPVLATTGDPFDSFSYDAQTGVYIKIGDIVMVQAALRTANELTGGSGNVTVSLPFTAFDIGGATTEGAVYRGGAARNAGLNAVLSFSIINNGDSFTRFSKPDLNIYLASDAIRGFGFVITYRV